MNRRSAIKQGSILAAGTLSLANYIKKYQDKKKLGIALVGLGNYATNQLAPALLQCELCELKGIVTGTPEKAKSWKKQYNLKDSNVYDYSTYDQIKENQEIDIIYIVLPNSMHAEYTIRGFEAGKHVISEKPMGMNGDECREMIRARDKAGKKLQIGYRLFYEPHHLAIQKWLQEQQNVKKKLVEASLGFDMARPGMWRIDGKMGGGGALMDLGVYTIQAGRRAIGMNPKSVTAQAYKDDPELYKDIFGTYSFQLDFPDGSLCNSTVSFSTYVDRYHVAARNDFRLISPAFSANSIDGIVSRQGLEELKHASYQQTTQMDAFAKNIMEDTEVVASGEEGMIDMQIIDAIKRSYTHNTIEKISYK